MAAAPQPLKKSDCRSTANRSPRCSWPTASRGARSRYTSPRTEFAELSLDLADLGQVVGITAKRFGLGLCQFRPAQAMRHQQGFADDLVRAATVCGEVRGSAWEVTTLISSGYGVPLRGSSAEPVRTDPH
jgi:hypothetical protein